MAELSQKLLLTLNMVKSDTIIVISLLLPRFHSLDAYLLNVEKT